MIIYKRPVPFRSDYILRKRKLNKKQKKALDKVDEILNELEESIIDALIFMWALEAELVDISAVETVLQNPGDTYGIIAPFGDVLDDFIDDTLRPTMTHIGNEGYEETREQIDDLVITEPPAIEEVPITPPPIGDDEQTEEIPEENAFDYAAFYEQWCDEHTGELIVDITDTQLADVKSIISTTINEGMSPEMAARRIADTVGLTERQLRANENYYNTIREQLAANNPNMSPAEIDRRAAAMAAKDADKKRRSRARSIARTEINIAHHKANEAYIKWAIEHGYMDAPDKEWVTSNKGNVCDKCLRLSQRAVPYNQEFVLDGFSVGLPPIHPQCCCAIIYVNHTEGRIYPTESEWDKMSEAERKAHINYFSDKAQYADYKKRLGKGNVPKTLAEFQQMKYNNTEEWQALQETYRDANPNLVRTGYTYTEEGIIIPTNVRHSGSIPKEMKPYSVLDRVYENRTERSYYDKDGRLQLQIHPTNHGTAQNHPFGVNGEHAHDYKWENGEIVDRTPRELTDSERKVNGDIL